MVLYITGYYDEQVFSVRRYIFFVITVLGCPAQATPSVVMGDIRPFVMLTPPQASKDVRPECLTITCEKRGPTVTIAASNVAPVNKG